MSTIDLHPIRRRPTSLGRGLAAERGFSLIVALMMLIVIIILGVSGSQMAINEERGARNDRDRQIAFQAAEAALKDAEFEIYSQAAPPCDLAGQVNRGRKRNASPSYTCFNEANYFGYALGCSGLPNAGLCTYVPLTPACSSSVAGSCPAYLDGPNVDFYKDALGSGNAHTVGYGQYSGQAWPTTSSSRYPPRYIIEAVPKNTSVDSRTSDGSGAGQGGAIMFRVTAMGFGTNPTSQVVLQAVVATQD